MKSFQEFITILESDEVRRLAARDELEAQKKAAKNKMQKAKAAAYQDAKDTAYHDLHVNKRMRIKTGGKWGYKDLTTGKFEPDEQG